jgi:hypothetical protein
MAGFLLALISIACFLSMLVALLVAIRLFERVDKRRKGVRPEESKPAFWDRGS